MLEKHGRRMAKVKSMQILLKEETQTRIQCLKKNHILEISLIKEKHALGMLILARKIIN